MTSKIIAGSLPEIIILAQEFSKGSSRYAFYHLDDCAWRRRLQSPQFQKLTLPLDTPASIAVYWRPGNSNLAMFQIILSLNECTRELPLSTLNPSNGR